MSSGTKMWIFIKLYRNIRCTTLLLLSSPKNWGFILKKWLPIYDSKYCPSPATTFFHLSVNCWIPSRKNDASFEAIHESIHFFTFSKERKCWWARPCAIDQKNWLSENSVWPSTWRHVRAFPTIFCDWNYRSGPIFRRRSQCDVKTPSNSVFEASARTEHNFHASESFPWL